MKLQNHKGLEALQQQQQQQQAGFKPSGNPLRPRSTSTRDSNSSSSLDSTSQSVQVTKDPAVDELLWSQSICRYAHGCVNPPVDGFAAVGKVLPGNPYHEMLLQGAGLLLAAFQELEIKQQLSVMFTGVGYKSEAKPPLPGQWGLWQAFGVQSNSGVRLLPEKVSALCWMLR
jgi:hypothetical protein